MALWVARNPSARAEAAILSSVSNGFISTKTGGPVNGQVQDSTVGCYELTRSNIRVDKFHAMGLFASAGVEPPRFDAKDPDELYTGRDIASLLLQRTPINYKRAPTSFSDVYAPYINYDQSETLTVVERGRLVRGVLDKKSVGEKATGGIFHLISREYGPQRALDTVFALQQISLQFLLYHGFTVGTSDLMPSTGALEQIRALVSSVLLEAKVNTDRLLRGEIVPPIGSTVHDHFEEMQIQALKVPETEILRWILGTIRPESNGFFRMIAVGSKGINPNLISVSGAIGQTTINAERITEQFGFRRTLPYFPRFAIDPVAYGFVANSYITGMDVREFTFQDMNGRFDLINKALTTATTGYFMRKGVMNNQSSIIDNYRRVSKDTKVVQFIYGDDGLDPRELERVEFRFAMAADATIRAAVAVKGVDTTALADAIIADRDVYRRVFMRVEAANFSGGFPSEQLLPVNIARIVEGVFVAAKDEPAPPNTDMASKIERVADLCMRLPYTLLNEIQERLRTPVPPHKVAATTLLCMLIRAELNPAILARLSAEQLEFIVDSIRQRYSASLIDYGTAAGILAVQSVSEPLTQYMLDSHHRSVAGGTNKAGLIRISEIYGARSVAEEQSAKMHLPLKPHVRDLAAAQEIANSIEYVTLRGFTSSYDTLLEPYGKLVYPDYMADTKWITEFERSHPLVRPPSDLTNWCFRFVLDKSTLVLKAVELELIIRRLRARHPGMYVVHTPEAVPEIVIRIWHRSNQFRRGGDDDTRIRDLLKEAFDTPIRGIIGITHAVAERVTRMVVAAEGDHVDVNSRTLMPQGEKTRPALVGELVKQERLAIKTDGTNLYAVMLHGAIDTKGVISSSVGDTYKMFGIDAAASKIASETKSFMDSGAPNMRHMYMYASEMAKTGRVTSVERGGLSSREHSNVLLRMAYGAPIQVVTDATFAAARSKVYGIAAPQLLGSTPQIGSLYNGCIIDEEFVKANTKSVDSVLDAI